MVSPAADAAQAAPLRRLLMRSSSTHSVTQEKDQCTKVQARKKMYVPTFSNPPVEPMIT
jgi:hypothetical protein